MALEIWSTLVQVMACCLTAPSHYLNQCWLIISKVLWHSSEDIIMRRFEDTNLPGANELNNRGSTSSRKYLVLDPNLTIVIAADVLAFDGAKPSAGTHIFCKISLAFWDFDSSLLNRWRHLKWPTRCVERWRYFVWKLFPFGARGIENKLDYSLADPRIFQRNFRKVIVKLILIIDGWCISCEITLGWLLPDLNDDQSTLVQVKASCPQKITYCLGQYWPISMSLCGATRPKYTVSGRRMDDDTKYYQF